MPWAIKAIVATTLIIWSNELEKWWFGGCNVEPYGWQPRQSPRWIERSIKRPEQSWWKSFFNDKKMVFYFPWSSYFLGIGKIHLNLLQCFKTQKGLWKLANSLKDRSHMSLFYIFDKTIYQILIIYAKICIIYVKTMQRVWCTLFQLTFRYHVKENFSVLVGTNWKNTVYIIFCYICVLWTNYHKQAN